MRRGVAGAGVLVLVDQACMAIASFLSAILVARQASSIEFGHFALLQVLLVLGIECFRATVGASLLAPSMRRLDSPQDRAAAAPIGLALAVVSAPIYLIVSWLPFGIEPGIAVSFIIASVGLLQSNALRFELHSRARVGLAAIASLLVLGGFVVLHWQFGHLLGGGSFAPVRQYGACALVVAIGVRVAYRLGGSFSVAVDVVSSHVREWGGQLSNYLVNGLTFGLVPYIVAAISGLPAAGGLRGAQTIVALPLQIPQAFQLIAMVRGSAHFREHASMPSRFHVRWGAVQAAVFGLYSLAFWLFGAQFGPLLMGDSWQDAADAIPFVLATAILSALTLGLEVEYKILSRVSSLAMVRLVMVLPTLGLTAAGAWVDGVSGAAAGIAVAQLVLLALATWRLSANRDAVGRLIQPQN